MDRIGALQQVEEVNNQEVNNINNFSKDIYKSLLANEYTIDEFFEKNVSKTISLYVSINETNTMYRHTGIKCYRFVTWNFFVLWV